MKDRWKEYWKERPLEGGGYDFLSHGKVVRLPPKVREWHEGRLVHSLSPGEDWILLDAGCGTGDDILRLKEQARWIVGIDFSLGMLKACKGRLESFGVGNASLVVADVRDLPFKTGSFDGSICMGVLLFLTGEEVGRALSELSRTSRRRIFLHGKNSFSPFGIELRLAEKLLKRVKERTPYDYHRPIWWYRRRFSKFGKLTRGFSIGLWIPQMPDAMKRVLAALEVIAGSLGLNHPFGKEYYVTIVKRDQGV